MKNFLIFVATLIFLDVFSTEICANPIAEPANLDRIVNEVSESHYLYAFKVDESSKEKPAWRKQHPTAFGALLGLGIGFGTGAVFAAAGGDTNVPMAGLLFGGIGAGIGALIGSFY